MPKFKVEWVKKYHVEGNVIIEADSSYDAEVIAWGLEHDGWGDGDEEYHHDETNIFCVTEETQDA